MFSAKSLVFALLSATPLLAVDTPVNAALNGQLKTAPNELAKLDLVKDDFVFDFTKSDKYSYSPGGVVNGNAATFPAATGHGLTVAWLALGPCAMLPPHFHPRATNFVVAVEGETETYMIQENGAKIVTTTLTPGKMTIFPTGSVHSMQNMGMSFPLTPPFNGMNLTSNPGCTNATLISALNSEDTGTTNLLNALFQLPGGMVDAAFGANGTASYGGSVPAIGSGSAMGSAECRAKCGL